ncbi:MAG: hypothetical protein AAGA85_01620 [Bacteroidota bacterium]
MSQTIPPLFHSFESGEPFDRCIECERKLEHDCEYVIEKAMKTYEGYSAKDVVFDYAICIECANRIRESFSKESLEAIDKYFANVVPRPATQLLDNTGQFDVEKCVQQCLITGKPLEQLKEYQVYAHCRGKSLQRQVPPYMVSNEAVEQLMPLLSAKTNDILDDFFQRHFSPDPSIFNPLPRLII